MTAQPQPFRPMLPAALLCIVAGYVDAVGYLALGHVFAANMTGNTVLLAIAAARGEMHLATIYVATLVAFFLGALLAAAIKRVGPVYLPLLLAAALLALAPTTSALRISSLLLLAASMGLQGSSLSTFGTTSLHTVVVTGTIMKLADGVIDRLWRTASTRAKPSSETLPLLTVAWVSYGVGAAAGAVAIDHIGRSLLVPALLLLLTAGDLAFTQARGK